MTQSGNLFQDAAAPAPDAAGQAMQAAAASVQAGDTSGALHAWQVALRQLDATDTRRADVLRHLGTAYREAGDTDKAELYYRQSLECATILGYVGGIAHATNWLAVLSVHRGRLEDAEVEFERARTLALQASDRRLLGMIEQNLGVLANIRGDLDAAIIRYRAALDGFRATRDAEMIASVLNNVGLLAAELQRWDEAEHSFGEAIQCARAAGLQAIANSIEVNVGALAAKRARWNVVSEAGDRAREHARRAGSRWREAEALRLSGMAARGQGAFSDAERDLTTAALLATESDDTLLEAQVACELGELFRVCGRLVEARAALSRALELFQRIGALLQVRRVRSLLAQLGAAAGS